MGHKIESQGFCHKKTTSQINKEDQFYYKLCIDKTYVGFSVKLTQADNEKCLKGSRKGLFTYVTRGASIPNKQDNSICHTLISSCGNKGQKVLFLLKYNWIIPLALNWFVCWCLVSCFGV